MIEINLLPEEMRRVESTPPVRLAMYLFWIVAACIGGVWILYYYRVYIPKIKEDIAITEVDIKKWTEKKMEVEKVEGEIAVLKQKVEAVDKLEQGRIKYARLLDRLCEAVNRVDGAWFREFNITPEGAMPGGGARYRIDLPGYVIGNTPLERKQKYNALLDNLTYFFRKQDVPPDEKDGFNVFLNAKFFEPKFGGYTDFITPPQPVDPELKKNNAPKEKGALEFLLSMSFQLRA